MEGEGVSIRNMKFHCRSGLSRTRRGGTRGWRRGWTRSSYSGHRGIAGGGRLDCRRAVAPCGWACAGARTQSLRFRARCRATVPISIWLLDGGAERGQQGSRGGDPVPLPWVCEAAAAQPLLALSCTSSCHDASCGIQTYTIILTYQQTGCKFCAGGSEEFLAEMVRWADGPRLSHRPNHIPICI